MAKATDTQKLELPSAENLISSVKAATKNRSIPPVEAWDPPFCGDLDMRIARDGTWFYLGTPIGRPEMVRLFSSVLRKDGDRYFLVTPVEKVGIWVDDAPFVAVDFEVSGEEQAQSLTFETHVGDHVTAGPDAPIYVTYDTRGEPSPYVQMRRNLDALIDRKSFYRLIDFGSHHEVDRESWFGLWSRQTFFPIIRSAEL